MQIAADRLRRLSAAILEAAGSSAAEAEKVAARLVDANLNGHDSHGVIRVPQYVDQVRSGDIAPNQAAEVVSETDTVTVLDGRGGLRPDRRRAVGPGGARQGGDARSGAFGAAQLGPPRTSR